MQHRNKVQLVRQPHDSPNQAPIGRIGGHDAVLVRNLSERGRRLWSKGVATNVMVPDVDISAPDDEMSADKTRLFSFASNSQ